MVARGESTVVFILSGSVEIRTMFLSSVRGGFDIQDG